jgi:hypothetical protein
LRIFLAIGWFSVAWASLSWFKHGLWLWPWHYPQSGITIYLACCVVLICWMQFDANYKKEAANG